METKRAKRVISQSPREIVVRAIVSYTQAIHFGESLALLPHNVFLLRNVCSLEGGELGRSGSTDSDLTVLDGLVGE